MPPEPNNTNPSGQDHKENVNVHVRLDLEDIPASDGEQRKPGVLQELLTSREKAYSLLMYIVRFSTAALHANDLDRIWCCVFVMGFSRSIFGVLTPYVTSSFQKHALTATTNVISSIASGIFVLPYAKMIEIWGRPHSMALMVVLTSLGAVMMAACNSVETYCAAQVFYYVGYYGFQFSLVIFISDSTSMANRGLLFGVVWSPSLISTWAYGPATNAILNGIGLRWGFGVWCIVIPVACTPLLYNLFRFDKRARAAGLIQSSTTSTSLAKTIFGHLREFDVGGLLMLAAGLSFILLAISIYSYQPQGWSSPLIICLLALGPLLIVSFVLYEAYLAPRNYLPIRLLKDRSVIWTNVMAASLYTSEFICSAYIYSMLIVVFDLSITQATYVNSIYYIGSSFWTLILGVAFRYYGRIKYYALVMGIPFFIIGQGLLITFRPGFTPVALMIFCKILIAFGGGTMYPIEQMTLMSVSQDHTPALLAIESVVVEIGKGTGAAIATAIWTAMFKQRLLVYLPSSEIDHTEEIYGSLNVQSSYPIGSEARIAINHAYLDTQRIIFIVATSLLSITWLSVTLWKDVDVRRMRGSV